MADAPFGQPEIPDEELVEGQPEVSLDDYLSQQGQFDDATPSYVTQQPSRKIDDPTRKPEQQINPNAQVGPDSVKPTERVSNEQLQGRVQPPKVNPDGITRASTGAAVGAGAATAAGAAGGAAASTAAAGAKSAATEAAGNAIKDSAGAAATGDGANKLIDGAAKALAGSIDPNSAAGKAVQAAADLAKDAKDVAELVGTAGTDVAAWWSILKRRWKLIFYPALLAGIAAFIGGLAVATLLSAIFGDKGGTVGTASTSTFATGTGVYLTIMADHMTLTTKSGKSFSVSMNAVRGGFSYEDPAYPDAADNNNAHIKNADGSWGGVLRFDRYYNATTGVSRVWDQSELDYYVTARWPYNAYYWTDTGARATHVKGTDPTWYVGRKVVIYNPKTNKAVVGIVAEEGPAVWTGIFSSPPNGRLLPDGSRVNPSQQAQNWKFGPDGQEPRTQVPIGYAGRVIGGPPTLAKAIGASSDTVVVTGFLNPAVAGDLPLGPVDPSKITVVQTGDTVSGSTGKADVATCAKVANNPHVTFSHTNDAAGFPVGSIAHLDHSGSVSINLKMCGLLQTFIASNQTTPITISSVVGNAPQYVSGSSTVQTVHWTGQAIDLSADIAAQIMPWISRNQDALKSAGIMPTTVIGPKASTFDGKDYSSYDIGGGTPDASYNDKVHMSF